MTCTSMRSCHVTSNLCPDVRSYVWLETYCEKLLIETASDVTNRRINILLHMSEIVLLSDRN